MRRSVLKMKNTFKRLGVLAVGLAPLGAFAAGEGPLDLSATGTTLAGYVGTGAGAALGVFAALYGVRVILRAFKIVK